MSLGQRWVLPSSETLSNSQHPLSPVDRVLPALVQLPHPHPRFDPHGPSQNRSTATHPPIGTDPSSSPGSGASTRRPQPDPLSPDSLSASQLSQDAPDKPIPAQPNLQLRPLYLLTQQNAGFPPPPSPPTLHSPIPSRPQNSPLAQMSETPLITQQQPQGVSLQRRQSATSQLQEQPNAQQRTDPPSSDSAKGSLLTSQNRVMSWDSSSLAKRLNNRTSSAAVGAAITTATQLANTASVLPVVGQAPKRGRPRKRPTVGGSTDTVQMEKPPPVPRSSKSPLNPPHGDGASNEDSVHTGQLESLLLRRPLRPDVAQPPAPHRSNTYSGQTRRELDSDQSNKLLPGLRPLGLGPGDGSGPVSRPDPWFPPAPNTSQPNRKRLFEEAADTSSKPVHRPTQPVSYTAAELERYRRISNPSPSQGLAPPKPAALPTSPRAYASKASPSNPPPPPPVKLNSAAAHTFPPASASAFPRTFSSPAGLAGNNPALHPFAQFRTNNMQPPPRTAPPSQQSSSTTNEVSSLQPRLSPIPMTVSPTPMHASPASSPDPPTHRKQRVPAVFRQPPSGSDAPAVVLMPSTLKPVPAVTLVEEFEECLDKLDSVLNRAEKGSWVGAREDADTIAERSRIDIREAVTGGMSAVLRMMRVACDVLKWAEVANGKLEDGGDSKRRRVEKADSSC
ncbi:hypothetical protein BJ742DRAFT_819736 [Cladochytrium replicatum]|nr:hypothetical protein BJ742DRAFT_819736 [Cladochytrium replicatum]